MAVKINSLELENIKRIKAVQLEPSENGLTVIGGRNGQGKTSVLDSIAWALGGADFKPSAPTREGSIIPPALKVTLSNGLIVERKGKNSELKVIDPSGQKAGQKLLDSFIEKLALDLPKFMAASDRQKADVLLKIIGVGDQLATLEAEEKRIYQERLYTGRTADQKDKAAKEMAYYPDAPEEPISASELIREQQEILARNGRNQQLRNEADNIAAECRMSFAEIEQLKEQMKELNSRIMRKQADYEDACKRMETAKRSAEDLQDESTAEIEESIANIEEINRKVRCNLDKQKAQDDADAAREIVNHLTAQLEKVRESKKQLLDAADLPLPGLSVQEGELVYKGQRWDCMSGSEQLMVATSIVRKLNPECGFVLLDKLEQMDPDTMKEFGSWLEQEGLQAIATRVSTNEDECTIIIEDGMVAGAGSKAEEKPAVKSWEGGWN